MMVVFALTLQVAVARAETNTALDQPILDRMSDACHAPRMWLRHRGHAQVQFQPSPEAEFETIECVLRMVNESRVPMELGFVGNGQASEEK
jgi:hypothetical protein